MRITASMAGIFLIAAVAVAQDKGIAAEPVAQNDSNGVAAVAIVMDDAAIAAQVKALQKHLVISEFSDKITQNKKTGAKTKVITIRTQQDMDDPCVGTMRLTVEMLDGTNMWYGQQMQTQVKQKLLSSAERKAEEKAKAAKKKAKGKKKGAQEKKTEAVATGAAEKKAAETKAVVEEEFEIDYAGEDVWNFKVPMGKDGEIVRPEVKAYAAEYGFVVNRKVADGTVVSNQFVVVVSKYKKAVSAEEIMERNQGSKVFKVKMTGRALKEGEGTDEGGEGGG